MEQERLLAPISILGVLVISRSDGEEVEADPAVKVEANPVVRRWRGGRHHRLVRQFVLSPTASSPACSRLQRCQVKNKRREIERENERREKIWWAARWKNEREIKNEWTRRDTTW
jgi:hypothetical protein